MTTALGRSIAASTIIKAGSLGTEPWREHLRSCVVDENVGLPDSATLVYDDNTHKLLAETGVTIGSTLEVAVAATSTNSEETVFRGEVTALELDVDGTGAYTIIRAMSKAHRLHRGRRVQAFRKMTAAAIVRKVAQTAGLAVGRVETASITYEQLSQAGVSDWDFLQQLAADHGAVVSINDQGLLEFTRLKPASSAPPPTDRNSPYVLEFGRNLRTLRGALSSAELAGGVEVRGWDVNAKRKVVARRDNTPSKTVQPGLTAAKGGGKFATRARTLVVGTPYGTQAQADAAADALTASITAGYGELEVVVDGNAKLRAGVPVTLANVGPDFTGKYIATAVTHVLDPDTGYRTTVGVSASYDRSLAGLNGPPRDLRMPGLATGLVTNTKEEAGGQRGWVRLMFPWLDDKYETDWVRTVQLSGGGVFSPEVNDEVLVGFEQGSLDRPYVLGKLYNGVDKPAAHTQDLVDATGGTVNRRSLVSRTGNRLELLDGTRASGVRLASGDKKLEVLLDEKAGTLRLTVLGTGGMAASSITLDANGITLDANAGEVLIKGRMIRLN